jgi:hypothetical protein
MLKWSTVDEGVFQSGEKVVGLILAWSDECVLRAMEDRK